MSCANCLQIPMVRVMFYKLYRFLSRIFYSAVPGARCGRIRHTGPGRSPEAGRRSASIVLLGYLTSAIRPAFHLPTLSLHLSFVGFRSLRRRSADAKLASNLNTLVNHYRWLCQEIEWLKCRIVGTNSYPIDSRRWKTPGSAGRPANGTLTWIVRHFLNSLTTLTFNVSSNSTPDSSTSSMN